MTSGEPRGVVRRLASPVGRIVEEAFDAHAGQLKAFALAAVRDDAAADDLVQETFLRFIREVRDRRAPDNTGGWLHRVCANLVISRRRRDVVANRKKALLVDTSVGAPLDEKIAALDDQERLRDALAQLPADARTALLMAAAGFSASEIAAAIGRSSNATSTYICRSRVRLRELLSSTPGSSR